MPRIHFEEHATGTWSRYILVTDDAPVITNIQGLLDNYLDDNLTSILILTREGDTAPVVVYYDEDAELYVAALILLDGMPGRTVEEVRADDDGQYLAGDLFVNGFLTDRACQVVSAA